MTFEIETAADRVRGEQAVVDGELLGFRYLDNLTTAGQEYRRAKRQMMELRATSPDNEALQLAVERLESARLAVKAALRT